MIKRWLPGGHSEALLGITQQLEALDWQHGLLQRDTLPAGVIAPIVGARLDPGETKAWLVMEDVAAALNEYSRDRPLSPAEAVVRVKQVLNHLARFHAWWERPKQQTKLRGYPWLVPVERFLWCEAPAYAAVLGRSSVGGRAQGSPVTDELRADVQAFLSWLPSGERRLWEEILWNRESLVTAFREFPQTLLHGDADDRNIGLRWPAPEAGSSGNTSPELILIDWEWMGSGPPALDFVRVWGTFAALCDLAQPPPETLFSSELPDYYFERYATHGGKLTDQQSWRQSYYVAAVAAALSQIPFFGSIIRNDVKPVMAILERQMEVLRSGVRRLLA